MHIQVTSKKLVAAIPIEDHLGITVFADVFTDQIIAYTGANCSGIIALDRLYYNWDGLEKIFFINNNFVMVCS